MTVRPVGRAAVLAEYPDTGAVLEAAAAVRALAPTHLVELVPAERTLLLTGSTAQDAAELRRLLQQLPAAPRSQETAEERTIKVVYDGEDLEEVAAALGMSTQALITAHTDATWVAAFGGFAPGFSYLLPQQGDPGRGTAEQPPWQHDAGGQGASDPSTGAAEAPTAPGWEVPRREEPRRAVPAGAVALASRYSAIYPRSSPGGWQLIGTTEAVLFDPSRTPPTLLPPGTRVRFDAQRATARTAGASDTLARAGRQVSSVQATLNRLRRSGRSATERGGSAALEILTAGPLTLVEDTGRPGRGDIGVPTSGVFDHGALVRANLAVGNPASAAGLEVLIGPVHLRARASTVVAVDGGQAPLSVRRRDEDSAGVDLPATDSAGRPIALDPGDLLELGPVTGGLRMVLAVRGGIREVQPADRPADNGPTGDGPTGDASTDAGPTDDGPTGDGSMDTGSTDDGPRGATAGGPMDAGLTDDASRGASPGASAGSTAGVSAGAAAGASDGSAELGSLSRDTLSGLGPAPLGPGDVLRIGPDHGLDAVPAGGPSSQGLRVPHDPRDVSPGSGPMDASPAAVPAPGTTPAPAPAPGRETSGSGSATDDRRDAGRSDDDRSDEDPSDDDRGDDDRSDEDPSDDDRATGEQVGDQAGLEVELALGPRDQLLGPAAVTSLLETRWTVREDSDRVGVRLDGAPLPVPAGAGSLPSEAMVPGAIQIPPSGLPVVFGPDHPTTGGYPVIGVVTRAGLDQLAQAAPGTTVRLVTGR